MPKENDLLSSMGIGNFRFITYVFFIYYALTVILRNSELHVCHFMHCNDHLAVSCNLLLTFLMIVEQHNVVALVHNLKYVCDKSGVVVCVLLSHRYLDNNGFVRANVYMKSDVLFVNTPHYQAFYSHCLHLGWWLENVEVLTLCRVLKPHSKACHRLDQVSCSLFLFEELGSYIAIYTLLHNLAVWYKSETLFT